MDNTTHPVPIHIAIIGGGIGGLSLAIGLSQKAPHLHTTIYEAASSFSEIGAGVGFGANSHRAMQLISPDIWTNYERIATFNGWESKSCTWFDFRHAGTGERIVEVQMKDSVTQSTVHRAHFLEEMVKLVPEGRARFGKRLVGAEQGNGPYGKVKLMFADGTTAEADAVVGCDGVRSACRGVVLGADSEFLKPIFTGKIAYRGLIPMDKLVELLGEEEAMNRHMYLGHGGHILIFPVAKGKIVNVVAFCSKKDGKWEGEWVKPHQKDNMMKDFEGYGDSAMKIMSLMPDPDVWALFEHPLAPTYHKGNICLLGDSAHASTPHFGAGAGMALEDAYVLSNLLGLCKSASDLSSAFKAYDAVRIPRTHGVIRESHEQGHILDLEGKGVGDNVEILTEKLNTRVRWIWDEDLEKHLESAVAIFKDEKIVGGVEMMNVKNQASLTVSEVVVV